MFLIGEVCGASRNASSNNEPTEVSRSHSSVRLKARGRIRMCIWKYWKRVRTRFKNLQQCGIAKWQAWQWANTRKGYWRVAQSFMHRAATKENLKRAGYPTLTEYYEELHPR